MKNLTQTEKQYAIKKLLIKIKGGKCSICGYNKNITSLCFHHLDPKNKDFSIQFRGLYSIEYFKKVLIELEKCILVCHNCHNELHHPRGNLESILDINEDYLKPRHRQAQCIDCGKEVRNIYKSIRCVDCNNKNREKADWPDFLELLEEVEKTSLTAVSKRLGVSRVAVSNRIKRITKKTLCPNEQRERKCKLCENKHYAKGLCKSHYWKNKRTEKRIEETGSDSHIEISGEHNGRAKLTWEIVREIRNKYKPRIYTVNMLAKEYGVNINTLYHIVCNHTWKE